MTPQRSRNGTLPPTQSQTKTQPRPARTLIGPTSQYNANETERPVVTRAEAANRSQGRSNTAPTNNNRAPGTRVGYTASNRHGQPVPSSDIFSHGIGNRFYGGHYRQEGGDIGLGREAHVVDLSGFNHTRGTEFSRGFSYGVVGGRTMENPSPNQMTPSTTVARMTHFSHVQDSVFDGTNMEFTAGNQIVPSGSFLPNNHSSASANQHEVQGTFYVFLGPTQWNSDPNHSRQLLQRLVQHINDGAMIPREPDVVELIDPERGLLRLTFSSLTDADEFTIYFTQRLRRLPQGYKNMRAHMQL